MYSISVSSRIRGVETLRRYESMGATLYYEGNEDGILCQMKIDAKNHLSKAKWYVTSTRRFHVKATEMLVKKMF